MNSTFKPALLLMFGRTLAFITTFFVPVVLVRIFDQTEFGTYKQIFLIYSTLYIIIPCGVAESLFYFLPLAPNRGGRYTANAMILLTLLGVICLGALTVGAPWIAQIVGNSALTQYIPFVGVYLLLTIISTVLEIVMTSRKQFVLAAAAYALSDMLRGASFVIPAIFFRDLRWLLVGAILFGALRLAATLVYIGREFHGDVSPDRIVLKDQLGYNLPFAAYAFLEHFGSQFHQYAVSYSFDAATFAIYAVGCLNIPLVELIHSPVSNVMMVRMSEEIREGRNSAVLPIWMDTTRKLALVFFPLLGLLLVTARDLIVFLFTENYLASVPIFMIWSFTVLLPVLQTDGVMRVYAQTRFLLILCAAKFGVILALIPWFLSHFHIAGAALISILAICITKAFSLARFKSLIGAKFADILPWKSLALNGAISVAAGAVAMLIRAQLDMPALFVLAITGSAYGMTYLILAFSFHLITEDERGALVGSLHRLPTSAARIGHLIRGI